MKMERDCEPGRPYRTFRPGEIWNDTDGRPIQAHGGGILYDKGVYFWFGENRDPTLLNGLHANAAAGISCYSSVDLYNWKYEGMALSAVKDDFDGDGEIPKYVERPKVLYNDMTEKYVMWFHTDARGLVDGRMRYKYARAGVATSSNPAGPYQYLGSIQPNGEQSRDMTLFKDNDGTAYLVYSSESNKTMHVTKLADDYTRTIGSFTRILEGRKREAPVLFKCHGLYYIITSGCTGWDSNEAEYAIAEAITGPWEVIGNPCIGNGAVNTFDSQSTFVLPLRDREDAFLFMADRWKSEELSDSRYIWLPMHMESRNLVIKWLDEWDLTMI